MILKIISLSPFNVLLKSIFNVNLRFHLLGAKVQILANLANFSYDPINYGHLRKLNVIDLFLGKYIQTYVMWNLMVWCIKQGSSKLQLRVSC